MNDKKEVTHLEDWRENMAAIAQWCRENNVGFLLNKSQGDVLGLRAGGQVPLCPLSGGV